MNKPVQIEIFFKFSLKNKPTKFSFCTVMNFLTESFFSPRGTVVYRRTPFEKRWSRRTKISEELIAKSSVRTVGYTEVLLSTMLASLCHYTRCNPKDENSQLTPWFFRNTFLLWLSCGCSMSCPAISWLQITPKCLTPAYHTAVPPSRSVPVSK